GNVYTTDITSTFQANKPDTAVCHANIQTSLSTGDSIRVADSAGTGTCGYNMHVLEFSGIAGLNPVDAVNSNFSGVNVNSATSNTINTTAADAVVGGVAWLDNTASHITGEAGWNPIVELGTNTPALTGVTEYLLLTTSGSGLAATSTTTAAKSYGAAVV